MRRMSSTRTSAPAVVEKFAGMSVNGTSVSPCASAGSIHSGSPSAASVPAATPPDSTARRLICGVIRAS